MDPITLALLGSAISAGGSALSGWLGKDKGQEAAKPEWLTAPESKLQTTQRNLVDDLLASLKGKGSFNDLFNSSDEQFQKSFVNPAKSMFNNQIAPQIQQNSIFSGQQRGSGLDDALARAGIDLDQMLNSNYLDFQQNAQNRQTNAIGSILGQQGPQSQLVNANNGTPAQSNGSAIGQGLGQFITGGGLGDSIGNILRATKNKANQNTIPSTPARKGFELPDFNPNIGRY